MANRSKYLSQFDLEKSLDDFQREIYKRGTQIVKAGDVPGRVWVLRTGEITAYDAEGRDVGTDAFEVPYGFIIIGGGSQASTMTVEVATEEAVLLAIDNPEVTGTREQANIDEETRRITLALAGSHALRKLPEEVLTRLSELGTYMNFCEFSSGDVIYQGGDPVEEVMTVVHGEVTVKSIKGERVVRADEVYGLEEMLSASPEHPGDVEVASDRAAIAFILYQDIVAGVERLLSQVRWMGQPAQRPGISEPLHLALIIR